MQDFYKSDYKPDDSFKIKIERNYLVCFDIDNLNHYIVENLYTSSDIESFNINVIRCREGQDCKPENEIRNLLKHIIFNNYVL